MLIHQTGLGHIFDSPIISLVLDELVKAQWKALSCIMSSCRTTSHFKNLFQLPNPPKVKNKPVVTSCLMLLVNRKTLFFPTQATLTVWKFDLAPCMTWSFCTLSCDLQLCQVRWEGSVDSQHPIIYISPYVHLKPARVSWNDNRTMAEPLKYTALTSHIQQNNKWKSYKIRNIVFLNSMGVKYPKHCRDARCTFTFQLLPFYWSAQQPEYPGIVQPTCHAVFPQEVLPNFQTFPVSPRLHIENQVVWDWDCYSSFVVLS